MIATRKKDFTSLRIAVGRLFCFTMLCVLSSSCATVYRTSVDPVPALVSQLSGDCVFLANTSPVDFTDLTILRPEKPAIEGFFDRIYSCTETKDILSKGITNGGRLTMEAEWVLAFENPLPKERKNFDDNLESLKVRFQGMAEGKWLSKLAEYSADGEPEWIPASGNNNFWNPLVPARDLPFNYRRLGEVNAILMGLDQDEEKEQWDSAWVTVFFKAGTPNTEPIEYYSSFEKMRTEVFNTKNGFSPKSLVQRVADEYYKLDYDTRKNIDVKGINLGAHGPNSALVNQPKKQMCALLRSMPKPTWVRTMRKMALSAKDWELILNDEQADSLAISNQPHLQHFVISMDNEGNPTNPVTGKPYEPAEYTKYLDEMFSGLQESQDEFRQEPEKRSGNAKNDDKQKFLLFVHGGLNTRTGGRERAAELYRKIAKAGYYPIFINWHSSFCTCYQEHLFMVRRGERGWPGIVLFPSVLLSDIGRGLGSISTAIPYQILNDIRTLPCVPEFVLEPRQSAEALSQASIDSATKKPKIVQGSDHVSIVDSGGHFIFWIITSPFKVALSPMMDGLGKPAWDDMIRRTRTMVHNPNEFKSDGTPIDSEKILSPATGALAQFMNAFAKQVGSDRKCEITLIGHSMGPIIVNEIISKYGQTDSSSPQPGTFRIKKIVYMAAACSIKECSDTVWNYMTKSTGTTFSSLMLSPVAEVRERTLLPLSLLTELVPGDFISDDFLPDLPPRGSLLVWIDNYFSDPQTVPDRTLGKHENIMRSLHLIPSTIRDRVTLKTFNASPSPNNPSNHGDFDKCRFWEEEFWSARPDDSQ